MSGVSRPRAAAGLVVTWSSGFVGADLASRALASPAAILGCRFAVLGLLLSALSKVNRCPPPSGHAWGRHTILGLLSQAIYLLLVFEGVDHGVSAGAAALIAALQPLVVAGVAGKTIGERADARQWLGLGVGLLGVGIVVGGEVSGADAWWVYLLPVAGMLSLAVGTVLTRRWSPPENLFVTLRLQSVVCAVALLTLALMQGDLVPPPRPDFWMAVLWLALLTTAGGYSLYLFVTRAWGATAVSTLLYLTPPITMVWVLLLFQEPISHTAYLGLAVSAGGVALVLLRRPGRSG